MKSHQRGAAYLNPKDQGKQKRFPTTAKRHPRDAAYMNPNDQGKQKKMRIRKSEATEKNPAANPLQIQCSDINSTQPEPL